MIKSKNSVPAGSTKWEVNIDFTKSVLQKNSRGAVVTVKNVETGKSIQRSIQANTKNEIRKAADRLSNQLKQELLK